MNKILVRIESKSNFREIIAHSKDGDSYCITFVSSSWRCQTKIFICKYMFPKNFIGAAKNCEDSGFSFHWLDAQCTLYVFAFRINNFIWLVFLPFISTTLSDLSPTRYSMVCICFPLLCSKLPHTLWLKWTQIYYLAVSVGQESSMISLQPLLWVSQG